MVICHTVITWLHRIFTSTWLQRWSFNSPRHSPWQRHPTNGAQASVTALKTWNLVSLTLWKSMHTCVSVCVCLGCMHKGASACLKQRKDKQQRKNNSKKKTHQETHETFSPQAVWRFGASLALHVSQRRKQESVCVCRCLTGSEPSPPPPCPWELLYAIATASRWGQTEHTHLDSCIFHFLPSHLNWDCSQFKCFVLRLFTQ